jgi:hypothetical protein
MPVPLSFCATRRARLAFLSVFLTTIVIVSSMGAIPSALAAPKKTDKREIDARQAFAAGRYEEALDLFAQLYAEKLHPTYLRNIGRCHQNLEQPEKANNAFRDYLRQAKDLSPAEKAEIEGYIAEMDALKKKQDADRAAAARPPAPVIPLVAVAPARTETDPTHPNLVQISTPPLDAAPEPAPFYTRGWFWGTVGGVVVLGVVGGLWAGGVFSKASNHCPAGTTCLP